MFLDVLHNPYVKLLSEEDIEVPDPESHFVAALRTIPDWRVPYMAYLARGELPTDEIIARQVIRWCKSMTIHKGELHK